MTNHFTLNELIYSRIAIENGLDNTPGTDVVKRLKALAELVLEPLRCLYGKPMHVTSGYRSREVNRLAGGKAGSHHLTGEAADLYIPEGPVFLLDILLESGLVFDQAIVYGGKRFLHVSYRGKVTNRKAVLWR